MNELDLYQLLETLGYPVAYDHFTTPLNAPPFVLYRNTDALTFKADDKVYKQHNNYIIDLITTIKDTTIEGKLETLLNNNYLPYDKEEDFIEGEQIYQIRYFI